jgi:hypothetical protein
MLGITLGCPSVWSLTQVHMPSVAEGLHSPRLSKNDTIPGMGPNYTKKYAACPFLSALIFFLKCKYIILKHTNYILVWCLVSHGDFLMLNRFIKLLMLNHFIVQIIVCIQTTIMLEFAI